MSRLLVMLPVLVLAVAAGCETAEDVLGTDCLLVGFDVLTDPNQEVALRARLYGRDLLEPREGCTIRFARDGRLFKATQTDADGVALVHFTPRTCGQHRFTAAPSPGNFPGKPPAPAELLVQCVPANSRLFIVDVDGSLVASPFGRALIKDPQPMPDSARVVTELAGKGYVFVYLTYRPHYFGPRTKAFLRDHTYPDGPLLLSDLPGLLAGSEAYKTDRIKKLAERLANVNINVEVGVGDEVSDVKAYLANGLKAYLILRPPKGATAEELRALAAALEDLSEEVQVVRRWGEIRAGVLEGETFPPSEARRRLLDRAAALDAPTPAGARDGAAGGTGGKAASP